VGVEGCSAATARANAFIRVGISILHKARYDDQYQGAGSADMSELKSRDLKH
jgi:hypothetical protein